MPQQPRDEWINVDSLHFHCRDWGGSGQPILLLHGLASTCHIWDQVAPILARSFAVVDMDLRGHGESAKPDHGYDFASVSGDVAGVIRAMNLAKPIVAGHSWGGDVALELAVAYPDIPGGLCFVDGGMIEPSTRYQSLDDAREQMAPPDFTGMKFEDFRERLQQRAAANGPAFVDMVLANFEVFEDGSFRAKLSRENHLRIVEALWDHHPPALYSKVACPVLIMPARQKDNPDAAARGLLRAETVAAAGAAIPSSKTVWMEDSIHDVPVQRPELVAGVIKDHIDEGFFLRDYSMLDRPAISMNAFYPRPNWTATPDGASDHIIQVEEGVALSSRFFPAGQDAPTVLFFYGNGETAADYNNIAPLYNQAGVNFFVADYRGYGHSGGLPTFSSMLADAGKVLSFVEELLETGGYAKDIYVMGRSMGRHSAFELATVHDQRLKGVIIESGRANLATFTRGLDPSVAAVLEADYEAKAASITIPALVIHGERDTLAPVQDATRMFDNFRSTDKHMLVVPGAGHNDLLYRGLQDYFSAIRDFVTK